MVLTVSCISAIQLIIRVSSHFQLLGFWIRFRHQYVINVTDIRSVYT